MTSRLGALAATAALVVTATLSACSSDPEQNTSDACAALEDYRTALDDLGKELSPDATVDDVRTARTEVQSAREALDDKLASVRADRVTALDNAWQDLSEGIDDLDGEATLATAAQSLQTQAQSVNSARADIVSALDCR